MKTTWPTIYLRYLRINCRSNVFTEPLAGKIGGFICRHKLMGGIYEVRRWDGLNCPHVHNNFDKDWFRDSKFHSRETDIQTAWQSHDPILIFFNKDSNLRSPSNQNGDKEIGEHWTKLFWTYQNKFASFPLLDLYVPCYRNTNFYNRTNFGKNISTCLRIKRNYFIFLSNLLHSLTLNNIAAVLPTLHFGIFSPPTLFSVETRFLSQVCK
jgi:hypothetical protein